MAQRSPVALYIHWPWCKAKCPYCDFNSHESAIQEAPYIDGLLREMEGWREGGALAGHTIAPFTPATRQIESVFFGGGTPSLMGAENLGKVIAKCHDLGVMDDRTEVTVECNPTSFDEGRPARDFFRDLKAAGVNRVSIGIQGLKPEWLAFLGRTHRVEEALATLDAAQSVFDNVNADVIYGLPDQQLVDWETQLESLAGRGLAHISAYQLTIEQNTRFFKDVRVGRWQPIGEDSEADFFEATRATLRGRGYDNYEISNFARPGMACRHNVHVWKYGEYLGLGAGAHGRVMTSDGFPIATQVTRQPEGYLRRMKDLGDGISSAIALNGPEAAQEAVFSGLRLMEGLDMKSVLKRFGAASCEEAFSGSEIGFLVEKGFLEEVVEGPLADASVEDATTAGTPDADEMTEGQKALPERHTRYLRLTEAGWPRLNSVLERILRPLPERDMSRLGNHSASDSEYKKTVSVVIE